MPGGDVAGRQGDGIGITTAIAVGGDGERSEKKRENGGGGQRRRPFRQRCSDDDEEEVVAGHSRWKSQRGEGPRSSHGGDGREGEKERQSRGMDSGGEEGSMLERREADNEEVDGVDGEQGKGKQAAALGGGKTGTRRGW